MAAAIFLHYFCCVTRHFVSFLSGWDKWCLSRGVLRGHLLFVSMMGKRPRLIKKNCGLPIANPSFLVSPAPQPFTPHWSHVLYRELGGQGSRDNEHRSLPLSLKKVPRLPAGIHGCHSLRWSPLPSVRPLGRGVSIKSVPLSTPTLGDTAHGCGREESPAL